MTTVIFVVCLLLAIGLILTKAIFVRNTILTTSIDWIICSLITVILLLIAFLQTAIYVPPGHRGIVSKKFGSSLNSEHVVAFNGERGPQHYTLAPGWNFWLLPWQYSLEKNPDIVVPPGMVGVVKAHDGKPLVNSIFSPPWEDPQKMMDPDEFKKSGVAGPQLTVLPPRKWPYNPNLYSVDIHPALIVKANECAVIKSNFGNKSENKLVDNDEIGIWKTPLTPGTYYMHPDAYEVIKVDTTKRVYSYTGQSRLGQSDRPDEDHSITVKTMDGFKFPVDVRVEVIIKAENAPSVVSKIGPPDSDLNSDGFDNLEVKVILPATRSIFRNTAESHEGLAYINSRSKIETESTRLLSEALKPYDVEVIAVRIADNGLDETQEGKELLKTQTDREIAKQSVITFEEQKLAAEAEKLTVAAKTEAAQQASLKESEIKIMTQENLGKGEALKAKGEAEAALVKIEALGGIDNYVLLESIKMATNAAGAIDWPQTLVIGGQSKDILNTAVLSKIIQDMEPSKNEKN